VTWGRWVQIIGLVLLVLWATGLIMAVAAAAGTAAAESSEPAPVVVWVSP
jgi:hypothetical protein